MATKESSDEFNPHVVTTDAVITKRRVARSPKDYLALAIATCGVGYLPLAPGTWGSIFAVGLYLLWQLLKMEFFRAFGEGHGIHGRFISLWFACTLVGVLCITMAGFWAANRVEALSGRKDPSTVVIDEVAGQLITFLVLPIVGPIQWTLVIAGFLLFRAFDIWKPYPIRRLESLEAGLGVMADDVLAGAYAATVLALLTSAYLFWIF